MKLVVVESPAKAKTIEKYLGKEYKVKSSKGHIVDLPKSGLAVDVEHKFKPEYAVTKPAVVKELKQAMKGADTLVLAVDPDREGEAIGWHVAQVLGVINPDGTKKSKSIELERIVFTEITKDAVQNAAANPRKIDMDLVHAQQSRRILDRLVGYKLSPLLWKKIRFGLSAGRVQSVAVRLIVDREAERDGFVPDEYWSVVASLAEKKSKVSLEYKLKEDAAEESDEDDDDLPLFKLTKIAGKKPELTTKSTVEKLLTKIETADWKVVDVKQEVNKKNPSAPFTTSTMQQFAANVLGFTAVRTMRSAQKLYEAGQITYMRTDSTNLSAQAIEAARKFLKSKYGEKFIPSEPNYYRTKSKVAQEAHEAIRPTDFSKTAADLGLAGDESRLYTAIRNRALSSQMVPAEVDVKTVVVNVENCEFVANDRKVKFRGYLQVSDDRVTEVDLPVAKVDQQLYPATITGDQHFTQPPPRYSEATLIKELEKQGIGRPSTYAPIIQTIQARGYVEKLGKYFAPTDTGKVVTQLLVKYFQEIVDLGFTAEMEDQLDNIADGKLKWVDMLEKFYGPFEKSLIQREKSIDRDEFTVLGKSDQKCPECGKAMVIKLGRYGRFISCSTFPECKGMLPWVGEGNDGKEINDAEFMAQYEDAPKTDDGRDYVLKAGRFGQFWAHPDYPKVKDAKPLVMKRAVMVEKYGEIPQTKDGKDYLLRKGRFGEFWAHPDYPKVKDIIKIKKQKSKSED